jgi:hypothetical protein
VKKAKKVDQGRKQKGGDVQTRVLDRGSVKLQALKAVQTAAAQKKVGGK